MVRLHYAVILCLVLVGATVAVCFGYTRGLRQEPDEDTVLISLLVRLAALGLALDVVLVLWGDESQ
jgi:hypothetical protein